MVECACRIDSVRMVSRPKLEIPQMTFRGLPLLAFELRLMVRCAWMSKKKKRRKLTREKEKNCRPLASLLILCALFPRFSAEYMSVVATYNHYSIIGHHYCSLRM